MDSLLPFLYDSFIRSNMPVYPGAYSAQPPHGKLRPPLMPEATPPVNRYRRSSSGGNYNSAVLAIVSLLSTLHQWFPRGPFRPPYDGGFNLLLDVAQAEPISVADGTADDFGRKTMPEIARSVAFHTAIVTRGALS